MIGETAYERKHGGRRLGQIVGQRTSNDAEGRPVEQWEIRSARGIKFFMPKADVRLASEPEPEPEPEPELDATAPPPAAHPAADAVRDRIEEELRTHRSLAPIVITLVGIVLCFVCAAVFALGLPRKLSENYGAAVAVIPGLVGLIIILVGTNLIGEQARRLKRRREKLEQEDPSQPPDAAPPPQD
jgi:hypothetical protein